MHIPDHGLICPVCGCTTLAVDGTCDLTAREIDDDATVTCKNCQETGDPAYFAHVPDTVEAARAVCAHHEVPLDTHCATVAALVESYLDARVPDLYDTLRDVGGCSKSTADAVCDAWATCIHNATESITLTSRDIPAPESGTLQVCAARTDKESWAGIDVFIDGALVTPAPVVTVAYDEDAQALAIDIWTSDATDAPTTHLTYDLTSLTPREEA